MRNKKESVSTTAAITTGLLMGPLLGVLLLAYNQLLWVISGWLGFSKDGGYDSLVAMMFATEQLVIAGVSMVLATSTILFLYLIYKRKTTAN